MKRVDLSCQKSGTKIGLRKQISIKKKRQICQKLAYKIVLLLETTLIKNIVIKYLIKQIMLQDITEYIFPNYEGWLKIPRLTLPYVSYAPLNYPFSR